MTGVEVAYGLCWWCATPFWFDADRVQSLPIDPETGLTPDLGGDSSRAVRQPICPSCCRLANRRRRAAGLLLFDETDTAPDLNGAHRTR